MTVIFEPASAIAAGLCLTARTITTDGRTARHPRPCGWCDYPIDDLRKLIDGFNAWAGWSERSHSYERHEARVFAELKVAEQMALVLEAQAFPAEEPVEAPVAATSHQDEQEGPAWMRA